MLRFVTTAEMDKATLEMELLMLYRVTMTADKISGLHPQGDKVHITNFENLQAARSALEAWTSPGSAEPLSFDDQQALDEPGAYRKSLLPFSRYRKSPNSGLGVARIPTTIWRTINLGNSGAEEIF